MRTLVYFASGPFREEYQDLNFNSIYLVDNCFRRAAKSDLHLSKKVTCLGMDCLKSIVYLKRRKVKIDCFISLNEGLWEGGGSYPINSDMFLGYAMPLFKDKYIHIMNKNYYQWCHRVKMDLPYKMEEIDESDNRYLSPFIFSKDEYHQGHAKVFQMSRVHNERKIEMDSVVRLTIVHDSIWNHYDNLDLLAISMPPQGQSRGFFDSFPKVVNTNLISIQDIFEDCLRDRINRVGFTPWAKGHYEPFINTLRTWRGNYPKEILLYHLNRNDYKQIKELA